MTSTLIICVATALVVFAILAKNWAGGPKKAKKSEKGEILKQLLALSEGENSASAITSPPARSLQPASTFTRSGALRNSKSRERNFKRKDFPLRPNPGISPKPKQIDAEIQERIRQRAYELYQERGGVDRNATDDWQQATEEVLSDKVKGGTASS
jgi:hypothetical protein